MYGMGKVFGGLKFSMTGPWGEQRTERKISKKFNLVSNLVVFLLTNGEIFFQKKALF